MALCDVCEALDIDARSRLGEYPELMKRADAGCDACRFYCDILQNSNRWSNQLDKLPGNIVFLSSQRLDVRPPEKENARSFSCDDLLFDYVVAENYTGPKDEDTDIRRLIPSDPRDEACFDQLRSWLTECNEHKDCPACTEVALPTRIIKVSPDPAVALKLVPSDGMRGKYVVLSHASDSNQEAKQNLPQIGDSFATSSLPKTFADAVIITRRLGYQYLWIDSLCILQDDPVDRTLETSKFATTYGQAALMISATAAEKSNSGIQHERRVFYSPALGKNKDRYMRQKLLRWNWDLKLSSSTSRGWNVLERILAPRTVHYTKRQMIWECADGLKYEAAGIPDKVTGSGQVRMNYRKSFVQLFITGYLQHGEDLNFSSRINEGTTDTSARLEAWHQTIDEISHHTFPSPKDKVLATSLIAKILNSDQKLGSYLSGLWTSNLASSLAWSRVLPVLTATPEYIAPSWSSLSVDGETSSVFLDWKTEMFKEQQKDPSFISRYAPQLISYDMSLVDENDPFGPVKTGSNITVSGSVTGLMSLLEKVENDSDDTFHPTFVLDKSWALDCSTCSQHSSTFSAEEVTTEQEKVKQELEHHVLLFIEGGFWGLGLDEGIADSVVLTKIEGKDGEGWERVGLLRLGLDYCQNSAWEREDGSFDRAFVERKFGGLGWERMDLRLF